MVKTATPKGCLVSRDDTTVIVEKIEKDSKKVQIRSEKYASVGQAKLAMDDLVQAAHRGAFSH